MFNYDPHTTPVQVTPATSTGQPPVVSASTGTVSAPGHNSINGGLTSHGVDTRSVSNADTTSTTNTTNISNTVPSSYPPNYPPNFSPVTPNIPSQYIPPPNMYQQSVGSVPVSTFTHPSQSFRQPRVASSQAYIPPNPSWYSIVLS